MNYMEAFIKAYDAAVPLPVYYERDTEIAHQAAQRLLHSLASQDAMALPSNMLGQIVDILWRGKGSKGH